MKHILHPCQGQQPSNPTTLRSARVHTAGQQIMTLLIAVQVRYAVKHQTTHLQVNWNLLHRSGGHLETVVLLSQIM